MHIDNPLFCRALRRLALGPTRADPEARVISRRHQCRRDQCPAPHTSDPTPPHRCSDDANGSPNIPQQHPPPGQPWTLATDWPACPTAAAGPPLSACVGVGVHVHDPSFGSSRGRDGDCRADGGWTWRKPTGTLPFRWARLGAVGVSVASTRQAAASAGAIAAGPMIRRGSFNADLPDGFRQRVSSNKQHHGSRQGRTFRGLFSPAERTAASSMRPTWLRGCPGRFERHSHVCLPCAPPRQMYGLAAPTPVAGGRVGPPGGRREQPPRR